jgi:hypothetical protein
MLLSELLRVTAYSIERAAASRVVLLGASVLLQSYPNLQLLLNSIIFNHILIFFLNFIFESNYLCVGDFYFYFICSS